MGELDVQERMLAAYNDVFADIVNALLFAGEQVVSERELAEAQPFSQYKVEGSAHGQERDVAKYWQNGRIRISLIGFENQTQPDADMPLRVIGYDGAAYRSQLLGDRQAERYPVLTLVLYFGTKRRWTYPLTLKECLHIPERIAPFVSDYTMCVYELAWLSDEQINCFRGDFKLVVEYLRAVRTKSVQDWPPQRLAHVHEVLDLFRVVSDDDVFMRMEQAILQAEKAKGGVAVCDFVQAIRAEGQFAGRNEGELAATDRIMALFSKLYADGRGEDVRRATNDRAYLMQLMESYQK